MERTLRTKPLDASRWQKELLAKRFTPSRAGEANPCARSLLMVRDGGRSSLPSALLLATLVKQALRTKIHTETCWRENAFTQTFSFTNVHRANFLLKPPCHAKSTRPRGRLYPSNCSQWPFPRFTSGISPYHCGQLSESRRSFQQNAPTFPAKRSGHSSETLRSFQRNAPAFSAQQLGLFTKKRHRTEQGFSLCPARCLDVQTIVRCLLLADLAHRQVGCGSSHKD